MPERHLVIFAKMPALGRVKRRLAREVGDVQAWRFYVATLSRTARRMANDARWRTWVALTPDGAAKTRAPFLPKRAKRAAQGTGDLGRRMARVMNTLPEGPVVIIGADVPAATPARVWRAFRLLAQADAVFGPAEDGGYWLVGTRKGRSVIGRSRRELFANVRWSTADALSDTMKNAGEARVALADRLADVDDEKALKKLRGPTF